MVQLQHAEILTFVSFRPSTIYVTIVEFYEVTQ